MDLIATALTALVIAYVFMAFFHKLFPKETNAAIKRFFAKKEVKQ